MTEDPNKDYLAVERGLRRRLAEDPDDRRAQTELVELLRHQERYDALCRVLEELHERSPANWRPLVELGRARLSAGEAAPGLEALREAVDRFPGAEDAWAALVEGLLQSNRAEEALVVVQKARVADPTSPAFANLEGIVRYRDGEYDEAIAAYDSALTTETAPARRAVYLVHRANALKMAGKLEEAIEGYRRAKEEDPDCLMATLNLGIALTRSGRAHEAIAPLAEAEILGVSDRRLVRWYGYALHKEKRHSAARALAQRVLERRPEDADALLVLGRSRQMLGEKREAIAAFKHALSFQPDLAEAVERLAILLVDEGDLQGARETLEEGVRRSPTNPGLRYNAASVARKAGDLESARSHAEEGLAHQPEHLHLARLAAAICEEQGDARHARTYLGQAVAAAASELIAAPLEDDLDATAPIARGPIAAVSAAVLDHFAGERLSALRIGEGPNRIVLGLPGGRAAGIYRLAEESYVALPED